jgi:TolB-like protein/Flp pilus assembly protein TadD
MDFGLARLQGQTKLTRTGATVGTVSYMSPEQARGNEVDHRSDIWSLGVVLYRMVAGRYPFEGEHQSAVMYLIMNEPHQPLTALRTGVPMDLERIVDKALAKDPGERYQSVSDMIVDLKRALGRLGGAKAKSMGPAASKPQLPRRPWVIGGVAVVIAVTGFFAWQQISGERGGPTPERVVQNDDRLSIAVLPLDNLSRDGGQEYVADGMTEALIAELAQIRALRVISRTSVMRFKKTTQPIPEIATALGVSTIIEGSVVQVGGRVRVTAQLIDAKTDEHLWAQSYERDMSDVLALQSDVARAIANEVKVKLTPDESDRLASSSAVDPRAYDLYMRGRYHWNRRTIPDLRRALELFEQAVDIQPDWALGYAALAETHAVMGGWSALPPEEAFPRGREFARRALELDPNLGSAWACLALAEASWEWDWANAEEHFRKAIEVDPNNASARQWYAEHLCAMGRFEDALAQIEIALKLDPLAMIVAATKAWVYYYKYDVDRAIAECERVIAVDPDFHGVYDVLGHSSRLAGRHEQAAEALARFYETDAPGAGESIRNAYARGGMDAVVRVVIGGLKQASRAQYVSPASIAMYFASIGEADSAMVWLEKAYDERAYPIEWVAVSPYCEPIHDDPRFIDLLKRMKLEDVKPAYARK